MTAERPSTHARQPGYALSLTTANPETGASATNETFPGLSVKPSAGTSAAGEATVVPVAEPPGSTRVRRASNDGASTASASCSSRAYRRTASAGMKKARGSALEFSNTRTE
jgi:hypothetical protein